MKIVMLAPARPGDFISVYAGRLSAGLDTLPEVEVERQPLTIGGSAKSEYRKLAAVCNRQEVDVVHLHHAPYLWGEAGIRRYPFWDLRYLLKKPIIITAHDIRNTESLLQPGVGTFWQRLVKRRLLHNPEFCDSMEIAPFVTALTIVHTAWERNELIARGANANYVVIVPPGVETSNKASLKTEAHRSADQEDVLTARPGIEDPYAVEEALATGKPVLAPETVTTREIVARVPCLVLFDPTNNTDYENKLRSLLADRERCELVSQNAHKYAQRFGWPRVAKQTLQVYRSAYDIFTSGPKHG